MITHKYEPLPSNFSDSNVIQCHNRSWLVESSYRCGNDLDGIVYCLPSKDVYIKSQYCMSVSDDLGEEVIGRCPYSCVRFNDPNTSNIGLYYKVSEDIYDLERDTCGPLNRRGLLCGKCKEGYGYVTYPYIHTRCGECHSNDYAQSWLKYVAISFGPLTLFLILVICLRINAASASMNAFIFVSQVISQPPLTRGFVDAINTSFLCSRSKGFLRFLHSLYGIWNLDFFVGMIPPFCLPH